MPYWRLSSIYFFYFAVVGALSPYWGLYLQDLGFPAKEIGVLVALPMLTKLLAPNAWSWFADRSGLRLTVIRLGAFGACVAFSGLFFFEQSYFNLFLLISAYSIFWNAVLPQFEVITLTYLKERVDRYSQVRLWGSVGFIVTVLGLGTVLHSHPISVLPIYVLAFLAGIFIFSCSLPPIFVGESSEHAPRFLHALKQNKLYVFFIVLFFLQFSHGVYYGFFSIYLEQFEYSKFVIGCLWALGVVCEIVIFIYVPALFKRYSLYVLLTFSLFITGIRWLLVGLFPNQIFVLVFAQTMHALSFGVCHAVAIQVIRDKFSEQAQGQGQAFYSAVSFGGGAALGTYLSGVLWDFSPHVAFYLAAFSALAAWLLSTLVLRRDFFR